MINLEHLILKQLNKSDLRTLLDWAKKEGWNPGEYDFDVFWKTDPNGYYGFYFDNKLIAGGAIISYNQVYGFMGLFIVHQDFRGQGIGEKLWYLRRDLLLKRLNKGATIGMDGVIEMQAFYKKGGFKIAFRDERYECIGKSIPINNAISTIEKEDFKKLSEYDLICFGYERKEFLKNWLLIPDSRCYKYSEKGEFRGYAVIRKVNFGFKIGPLFAENYKIAEELYKTCLNSVVGESVYIDIPVLNKRAIDLMKKYKAEYTFECARMYYGDLPKVAIDKVYGITTFELG